MSCEGCKDTKSELIEQIKLSAFPHVARQCPQCGIVWAMRKSDDEPHQLFADKRWKGKSALIKRDPRFRHPI